MIKKFGKIIIVLALLLSSSSAFASTLSLGTNANNQNKTFCADTGDDAKVGQSFLAGSDTELESVTARIRNNGIPSGNFWVSLQADSAGSPSGTALATSDLISYSVLTGTYAPITFDFSSGYSVTPASTYWFVFECTDLSVSGEFKIDINNANSYADGQFKEKDGASWNTGGGSYDVIGTADFSAPAAATLTIGTIGTNPVVGSGGTGTGVLGAIGTTSYNYGYAIVIFLGAIIAIGLAYLVFRFGWRKVKKATT